MKKIFLLYLLFSLSLLHAQQISNRFAEAEKEEVSTSSTMDVPTASGPPVCPPGSVDCVEDPFPVPIDDYISLLFITAIGLMFVSQRRQQHLKSPFKRF